MSGGASDTHPICCIRVAGSSGHATSPYKSGPVSQWVPRTLEVDKETGLKKSVLQRERT